MNNFRLKIERNFDLSSINHPITMHHAYVGFEYMGDNQKVNGYRQKLLSEGYNLWDINDCFEFVDRFRGEFPKKPRIAYFTEFHEGEKKFFNIPFRDHAFKIISCENYVIYSYYFTFPHNLNLPEKSYVTKDNIAINFVSWWKELDDKTFFNPSFWQSINWVGKEREWKLEGCKNEY
jgi:hypothetical protein